MLKKLLVAVLALTIMIGLFSPALAANTKTGVITLDQAIARDRAPRSSPGCTYEVDEYYYAGYNKILQLPNAYGDDYLNTRFTNGVAFELQYLECTFYKPYTTLGVGVTIYAWKDLDTYPDLSQVIYSAPVNPIPFPPTGNFMYIGVAVPDLPAFSGDFHIGFSPIVNVAGQKVGILADAGQSASQRSSFYEDGVWYMILDPVMGWGADYALCIDAYKCATPDPLCEAVPNATDQWPIWCHDFGRSSQSGIQLGTDLCGLAAAWVYDVGTGGGNHSMFNTSPLIVNDKVYVVYNDRVVCLNLLTGLPIWSSKTFTGAFPYNWGPAVLNSLANPAIVDGYLYMGTGTQISGSGNAGFIKVDAATGALIWGRGADLGANLEGNNGNTQVSAPVIIGDKVFFGNQKGILYA
ncbi:MAG: PQQ-binding-like beta-propeller repeat protein, partial [Sedimentisphaerales bacterium]